MLLCDGDDVPALGLEREQLPGVEGDSLPLPAWLLWVGLLPAVEMP
jgi:hypothetical protein